MQQNKQNIINYIISDFLLALISNIVFTEITNNLFSISLPGCLFMAIFWVLLFTVAGNYQHSLLEKSRLVEFFNTLLMTALGTLAFVYIAGKGHQPG
jgi:hypothetical protein